jgi:c-di-GMP phosphodiesterase
MSSNQMSLDVVTQAFIDIGLDRLTEGRLAFINFSREMLLNRSFELLDRESVVIELLENVLADEPVLAACAEVVKSGYTLALDDYTGAEGHHALLELATIVKVDVLDRSLSEVAHAVAPLRQRGRKLLAERVETEEVHRACRDLGFDLFQGYFYSRPEILGTKGMGADQLNILRLMNLLHDERSGDHELEETFLRDPALSYKLLRIVNSAASGGHGIESISHAIRLLGRGPLHRWLALLLASSLSVRSDIDLELIQSAVLRGRFCERLGRDRTNTGQLFILGLFSLMDTLLRTPMAEILEKVNLSDPVRKALLRREGPYAPVLELAEAYRCRRSSASTPRSCRRSTWTR